MDWSSIWLPAALLAINLLLGWGIWSIRQAIHKQLADALEGYNARLGKHDERILRIETDLRHAPTHGDMAYIKTELARLGGRIETHSAVVDGMAEAQKTMAGSVQLMNQYLLEKARS